MKVPPRLLLAMLATLFMVGCRAAGTGSLAQQRPPQIQARPRFDLDAFVAQHNENAELIRSIKAAPSIVVKHNPPGERSQEGKVDGRLAVEQPRNFKLELSYVHSKVADIGSNDERFWFWFSNKNDKSIYVCNYEDLGTTSLAASYQPQWIAEALGLRQITRAEAAQAKVRPGPVPGTTAIAFPAPNTGSQSYSRLLVVSDQTMRINELRVFAPDGKTMLAQATIPKYLQLAVTPEDSSSTAGETTCELPENLKLEWVREHLSLDVYMRGVKLNELDEAKRTAIFIEPALDGYARVNLAEVAPQMESQGATAVRETLPVPEPKSRSRRVPPLQIRGEKAASTAPKAKSPAPATSPGNVMLPVVDLDLVTAPLPRGAAGPGGAAYSSLAVSPAASMER